MGVIALHTFYIVGLTTGAVAPRTLMFVALAAYAMYVVNAIQFILKLRAARLMEREQAAAVATVGCASPSRGGRARRGEVMA